MRVPVRPAICVLLLAAASQGDASPADGKPESGLGPVPRAERSPSDDESEESRLREAARVEGLGGAATVSLARWLLSHSRFDEALPFLSQSCGARKDEWGCAAAAAVHVARGEWAPARRIAAEYLERACFESDRLRTVTLLESPALAITAGQGLVRLAPTDQMSYLLLAAAQHLSGLEEPAARTIEEGRRNRRTNVKLLESVRWGAVRSAPAPAP